MRQVLIATVFIYSFSSAGAQSVEPILGAQSSGMGNISSISGSAWSVFNNPAGLAKVEDLLIASTCEIKPALPAANRLGALITTPFQFGVLGGGFFRFGDDLYNEQMIRFAYSNKIGNTSLGIRASYIQYHAEGYGTHGVIGIDFGGITKLTDQLFIGAWIQNLNQPKLDFKNEERTPIKLYATLGWSPSEKLIIATELEKDVQYDVLWKTGFQYSIHKKIIVRSGYNLNPNSFFAGLGFNGYKIKVDYSLQSFTRLSAAHQASASYRISKPKKS